MKAIKLAYYGGDEGCQTLPSLRKRAATKKASRFGEIELNMDRGNNYG